jgi:predicted NBD/HSP70 family sugar kinase
MKRRGAQDLKMIGVRDVRDINQTVFLHLIRERQPISRAEIVKATGLRPGTVSAIVNRLIKERLVYEGVEGPSSGGRPPRFLYVNAESAYVIAVDIGVRNSLYAVSDFNGRILTQRAFATEGEPVKLLKAIATEIRDLVRTQYARAKIEAVGVSVPGLVDRAEGSLIVSPNQGWKNIPVRAIFEKELELPVYVENDANAAAFAELWYGPLDEVSVRTLLCVLVVEGLGTGLFINGELHVGTRIGLGGFGHMVIDPAGHLCSCGRRGCWETFASDRATLERFNASVKPRERVKTVSDIISLANDKNAAAVEALKVTARYLGEGIANLAHGLSPEVVVIGGAITGAWPLIGPIINEHVKSNYIVPPMSFVVRPSSVQHPSLFGAIPIALQHCFRDTRISNNGRVTADRTRPSPKHQDRAVV